MRCVRFWHKIMTHLDYEKLIIRRAAMEALSLNTGCWVAKLQECFRQSIWVEQLPGKLPMSEEHQWLLFERDA